MKDGIPDTIPIVHDEYHTEHIGRMPDGRQFILNTPFVPAIGGETGGEYIALYLFDADGTFLEAQIDALGPRASLDQEAASQKYKDRLASLGDVKFCDVRVAPFVTNQFGVEFGLIPREQEDEEDEPTLEMHPGNYMAFFYPWTGEYDT